jgi:hypothetical protein
MPAMPAFNSPSYSYCSGGIRNYYLHWTARVRAICYQVTRRDQLLRPQHHRYVE